MPGLMLVLAFVFMSPGLPPLRVAAPMENMLPLRPWQGYYPEITSPFIGGDLLYQQLPWHHWAQDEFLSGRFPTWASGPAGGMPLYASMQPAVLYPLHLLWVLMPTGAGLGIIMALKLWLAGMGMWLFLRAIDLHPAACALSALSYMFSASIVNWLSWQHSCVLLLLPWLLWMIHLWWQGGRRMSLAGAALVVGLSILGGHPETVFIIGLTAAGWTLSLLLLAGCTWRSRMLRVAGLVLAVVLGFFLGMIQLLPFLEALGLSHQFVLRAAEEAGSHASTHLHPDFLVTWLEPRYMGYMPDRVLPRSVGFAEGVGYVGFVPLIGLGLLVPAAIRRELRASVLLPWLAICIFAWVVAYDATVGSVIRRLPGFAQSINVRWIWVVGFAAIVLGAFGWDWLARIVSRRAAADPSPNGRWVLLLSWGLIAAGVVIMAVHALGIIPPPVMEPLALWWQLNEGYRWYWAVWSVGLFLAMLGIVFLWVTWRKGPRVAPVLLALAVLVDLWTALQPVNGTSPADQYYPVTDFIRQVKAALPEVERVLIEDDVLPANTGLVYNIRDWRAGDPMISQRAYRASRVLAPKTFQSITDEYNVYLRDPRYELAPLLGMRYFITPWNENPNTYEALPNRADFTRLARKDGLSLWRAEGVPGFTYLSDNVQAAAGEEQALDWLKTGTWDTARSYSAVAEASPDKLAGIQHIPAKSPGNVEVLEYTSGYIRLNVNAERNALVVVSESWYPGWRATLDGQPVEILRTNYLSQGVVVPQGSHIVEMNYHSDALNMGAVLSLLGVIGMAGLGVWARRSSSKQTPSSAQR